MIHGRSGRLTLVAMYGMGDSYLVCALADAVHKQHGHGVTVILKDSHAAIGRLFGDKIRVETEPDAVITRIENDGQFHQAYENRLIPGSPFYVHPHFLRSNVRIDRLCLKPAVTHADMFRAMLQLDPYAPLMQPSAIPAPEPKPRGVYLCPEASSWPNTAPKFWSLLRDRLAGDGWQVTVDNKALGIQRRLEECAKASWVIGPQFGLMAVITAAQFPCRKTFCSPSVDGNAYPGLPLKTTFPYAYAKTFAGFDYDIEEYKITPGQEACIARMIAESGGKAHSPEPKTTVTVDLSPGEFFDRLAILRVKMERIPTKRNQMRADYLRLVYAAEPLLEQHGSVLQEAYNRLIASNTDVFDHNEIKVKAALSGKHCDAHAAADKASLMRMGIKQEINRICSSAFPEVKSFFHDA